MYSPAEIANVCHEANRVVQLIQADPAVPVAAPWGSFAEKAGVIDGVMKAMAGYTPEQLHASWCDFKRNEGFVYGPVKNTDKKEHPCLVPYEQLPDQQRTKDQLFKAIVTALSNAE